MISSLTDVLAKVAAGSLVEHKHGNVEAKRSWDEKYGQKISALANRRDQEVAWLVIGVNDDGTLAGHSEAWAKKWEETMSQHLNSRLEPVQTVRSLGAHQVSEAWIIVLEIRNPGAVVRWNRRAYKGAGTSKLEMTPEEVMELQVALPGLHDFSAQPASWEASDHQLIQRFATHLESREEEPDWNNIVRSEPSTVLQRLRIDGRQAARILFGSGHFRFVVLDDAGDPIRNEKHVGVFRLLTEEYREAIQEATRSLTNAQGEVYPKRALEEALANAVAHAAYFERDGDIIVEVTPSHLSVSNLCLRESTFFANKWFSRSHSTVNALLMETLRVARFVDELGRGKNVIMAEALKAGHRPPIVLTENAGRYNRWKLLLHGGRQDDNYIKVLRRLREHYKDEKKALLANALIHWREQPLSNLRAYVDDESLPLFSEVLADPEGPIILDGEGDKITVKRWVSVALDEGKDSKSFSAVEERAIIKALRSRAGKRGGEFKPADLREVAGMGTTASEQVLSSNILKRWRTEKVVERVKHGVYRFTGSADPTHPDQMLELLKRILEENKAEPSP